MDRYIFNVILKFLENITLFLNNLIISNVILCNDVYSSLVEFNFFKSRLTTQYTALTTFDYHYGLTQ